MFLIAAYTGLASGPTVPPQPPSTIAMTGVSEEAATPQTVTDLPLVLPSLPDALAAGPSQVLAVGHQVQLRSLRDVAASGGGTSGGGPVNTAIGGPGALEPQPYNPQISVSTSFSPTPQGPGASPPRGGGGGNGGPNVQWPPIFPLPTLNIFPTPSPQPQPTPTPSPSPAPSPTPSVTGTVTPPSSTVTPTP
jgi:hypothetical protein